MHTSPDTPPTPDHPHFSRYALTAEVLRMLAGSTKRVVHSGAEGDPIRHVLCTAAEACERVDQAEGERQEALLYAAELWCLLDQAASVLDAQPLPADGGDWAIWTLAHHARVALQAEPHLAGQALLDELRAARVAVSAAITLAAAHQQGDDEQLRQCLGVFAEASRAWQTAASRPVIDTPEDPAGAGGTAPEADAEARP